MTIASNTRKASVLTGAALAALLSAGPALALPVAAGGPYPVNAGGAQPTITGGNGAVDVNLNAARTIIDWSNFNLGTSETANFYFDQRNWIVLNRVSSGAVNIDGTVRAVHSAGVGAGPIGGNVWFYSPNGVAFGPGATVDVGGLLATSAAVDTNAFLNASNLNIPFTGSGSGGPVTLAGGGQFNGSGYLAFVAPIVTTGAGANVTAGDYGTAAYGAVDSYEIRFRPTFNNDLTFFTFIVPGGAAGTPHATPLSLAGATTGANVYLMAISRQAVTSLLINAPGLLVGQSSFAEYGQVTITTGRNITEGQVNELSSEVVGAQTGSVQLGDIDAEGNANVYLSGANGSGDLQANTIRAGQAMLVVANNVTANALTAGDVGVNLGGLRLVAAGTVDVPFVQARTLFDGFSGVARGPGNTQTEPVFQLGSVSAGAQVQLFGQSLSADAISAPSIQGSFLGDVTIDELAGSTEVLLASLATERFGTISSGGLVRLTFADLELSGGIAANEAVLRFIGEEAIVGGTGPGRVDGDEFQRISVAESLSLFGGLEGNIPFANDVRVEDLDIDPDRIPELRIFAKATNAVRIQGVVRPTAEGVHLQIGDPEPDSVWKPGLIAISGSLGSAEGDALAGFTEVQAFDSISLTATDDILIGSDRFLELIADVPAAQIDIGQGLPVGVAAVDDEIGRLFIVAGSLSAFASDRIVQQNTGALGAQAGFLLNGQSVEPDEPLLRVGGAQIADMFGALQIGDGIFTAGQQASFSQRVARFDGDTTLGSIRINGCLLGVGCALSTPATQFRIQQFRPAAPRPAVDPPVLTPPPPVEDEEREAEAVITGAGNEEIWRRDQ